MSTFTYDEPWQVFPSNGDVVTAKGDTIIYGGGNEGKSLAMKQRLTRCVNLFADVSDEDLISSGEALAKGALYTFDEAASLAVLRGEMTTEQIVRWLESGGEMPLFMAVVEFSEWKANKGQSAPAGTDEEYDLSDPFGEGGEPTADDTPTEGFENDDEDPEGPDPREGGDLRL
jgi:hypothetical protein